MPWTIPALLVGLIVLIALCVFGAASHGFSGAVALCAALLVAMLTFAWAAFTFVRGLARLDALEAALDKLLTRQMFPQEPNRKVLMRDFGVDGRPGLKVVAANLKERRLQLFSADRTPTVSAASAVAASICLPIVFAPRMLNGALHIDGGIVSNLPAWAFDEERELDPDAVTLALKISEAAARTDPGRSTWISAAVRTALFGSAELNLRAVGRAELVELRTDLGVLDFDRSGAEVIGCVRQATDAVRVAIDRRVFRIPAIYKEACRTARAIAEDALRSAAGGEGKSMHVRAAIAKPDHDHSRSLRLFYVAGYEGCPDEGVLLPLEGSVVGAAWSTGETRFEKAPFPSRLALPGRANRQRRDRIWPTLRWTICIPIPPVSGAASDAPKFVVALDGDGPLADSDQTSDMIQSIDSEVRSLFGRILREVKQVEDEDGTVS